MTYNDIEVKRRIFIITLSFCLFISSLGIFANSVLHSFMAGMNSPHHVALNKQGLKLFKTVRNITQSGTESTINNAKPGDVLEYKIYFTNQGSTPLTQVEIFDNIPMFTYLHSPLSCGTDIPPKVTCVLASPTNNDNNKGYQGQIRWRLIGKLLPQQTSQANGSVRYRVIIE